MHWTNSKGHEKVAPFIAQGTASPVSVPDGLAVTRFELDTPLADQHLFYLELDISPTTPWPILVGGTRSDPEREGEQLYTYGQAWLVGSGSRVPALPTAERNSTISPPYGCQAGDGLNHSLVALVSYRDINWDIVYGVARKGLGCDFRPCSSTTGHRSLDTFPLDILMVHICLLKDHEPICKTQRS